MLQNQNPVRRWKQWLVLPTLGGLFLAACQLTDAPPIVKENGVSKTYPFEKSEDGARAVKEVLHLDSMRTNGKFEPGTIQVTSGKVTPFNPKTGQARQITITVTRVPASPTAIADTVRLDPQPVASSGDKVYTYVEQMPQLPGGGGQRAIVDAVLSKLTYPKLEKSAWVEGRVFVKFTVDATGHPQDIEVVKGLAPAYDAAVLAAVRQLPTFEPGRQDGKAVSVSFTLPVLFTTTH